MFGSEENIVKIDYNEVQVQLGLDRYGINKQPIALVEFRKVKEHQIAGALVTYHVRGNNYEVHVRESQKEVLDAIAGAMQEWVTDFRNAHGLIESD